MSRQPSPSRPSACNAVQFNGCNRWPPDERVRRWNAVIPDSEPGDSSRPWTLEEEALARDWYAAGRSPAFIARELGRTAAAVRMHLSRLRVRRPSTAPGPARRKAPDDI